MAIGMVELQGTINRTQDFQQLQQHENERGILHNAQQQVQVEEKVQHDTTSVHNKENAAAETDADERQGSAYGGDGGRQRNKKGKERPADRVIDKKAVRFDIKI